MGKSNSFSNGPGASACNGNGPGKAEVHREFCACSWCLQGIR